MKYIFVIYFKEITMENVMKNSSKSFKITIGTSLLVLLMLLTGIGMASVPPPPANQLLGTYDTNVDRLTEQISCRVCHTSGVYSVSDRHNSTGYNCVDCHPTINDQFLIDRNCLNCHNGSAFYANPNLTIGKPHHNTTYSQQRDCKRCHGSFIDNYDDGHYIPTYNTSMKSDVCKTCHEQKLDAVPQILSNSMTHHGIMSTVPLCTWCHPSPTDPFNIRGCEQCHGVQSLHNIQYQFVPNGSLGYGHVNNNWDCKGCHVDIDSNHGENCIECHPYPITTPVRVSRISGTKFNDSDGDGIRDSGESGVYGINIILKRIIAPGFEIDAGNTATDINGNYTFLNLSAGFYKIRENLQGVSQTFPAAGAPHYINLSADEVINGLDFGNQQVLPGKISGKKFNDTNGNGVQDIEEEGLSGIKIILSSSGRNVTTNSNGDYTFNNVPVGWQTVYEEFISGYTTTTQRFVSVEVNSSETSIVNFGNRKLVPPPSDIYILQQIGNQNGIPTIYRPGLTTLRIQKNLSGIDVIGVNLTVTWMNDAKTVNMEYNVTTGLWEAILSAPFSSGTARMRFDVDVAPAGSSSEDMVQIGDIRFIDPSGQIRNACNNKPINDAKVTLWLEFPPTTGNFIVSPSENQLEANPQNTSKEGFYGWMTLAGTYKVTVSKDGYDSNESESVEVPPPRTDLDLLLTPTSGCFYNFDGFLQPVENPPIINKVKSGSVVPLKFSLDGYQGLDVFDTDYPKSSEISCDGPVEAIGENETVTVGENGLSYNDTTDQYKYLWKTDKQWTNCRQLVMKFNDGTYHRANFLFR